MCTQIPEEVFEEVLLSALQTDLASAFSTPEQLQLLLVALQRFPQTLKPKKLKKLLGSTTIINKENIPKYDVFFSLPSVSLLLYSKSLSSSVYLTLTSPACFI